MKLLLFEYATAKGLKDPSITIEGRAMLQGLINDFNKENTSFLISDQSLPLESGGCLPLTISEDPIEWMENGVNEFDACLPIAPEEDMVLYHVTRIIEDQGLKVAGSNSEAVLTCSDKWETYKALKNIVPMVNSRKIYFHQLEGQIPEFNNEKMVVKPADGVSCSGVQLVNSEESFISAAEEIRKISGMPFFLLQDYLDGTCASVSLLCDGFNSLPLSLNLQKVLLRNSFINYNGCKVPLIHHLVDEAYDVAKRAVESIKGLRGYIGVDMILGDEVKLLEVNSRLTTSYIALRELIDLNLGQAILEACQGRLPDTVNLKGQAYFSKGTENIDLRVIR